MEIERLHALRQRSAERQTEARGGAFNIIDARNSNNEEDEEEGQRIKNSIMAERALQDQILELQKMSRKLDEEQTGFMMRPSKGPTFFNAGPSSSSTFPRSAATHGATKSDSSNASGSDDSGVSDTDSAKVSSSSAATLAKESLKMLAASRSDRLADARQDKMLSEVASKARKGSLRSLKEDDESLWAFEEGN